MNRSKILSLCSAALLLLGCSNDQSVSGDNDTSANKSVHGATDDDASRMNTARMTANFTFEEIHPVEDSEFPRSIISVEFGDKIIPVDTVSGTADFYPKAEYKQMEVPDNALAVCGAWYAGAGDYFYLVPTENGLAVYVGFQDEEQGDDDYHWKLLKEIN
ncbi:MAG TPA: hypothetical protein VK826_05400 [Bacteroidia bacterium]|nr:hypothetical protein [Bacteroidia bacterium]